jgi:hypothetical protein
MALIDVQTYSVVLGSIIDQATTAPRNSRHLRLVLKPTRWPGTYDVEIAVGQNWRMCLPLKLALSLCRSSLYLVLYVWHND